MRAVPLQFFSWMRRIVGVDIVVISYCDIIKTKIVEAMKLWWKEVILEKRITAESNLRPA